MRPSRLARYHTDIKDSYDLGFLFGTFLGDGHAFLNRVRNSDIGNVSWSFGADEEDLAEKLASAVQRVTGVAPTLKRVKSCWIVRLYSLQWTRLLAQFGKRTDKHLPAAYLCRNRRLPARPARRACWPATATSSRAVVRASATPRRGWSSCGTY